MSFFRRPPAWGWGNPPNLENYPSLANRVPGLNVDFWYLNLLQRNIEEKEKALESLESDLEALKIDHYTVMSSRIQISNLELQISSLKEEIEKLYKSFRYFCNDTQPN